MESLNAKSPDRLLEGVAEIGKPLAEKEIDIEMANVKKQEE